VACPRRRRRHGEVWAETLHGRRRWFAYPAHASPTGGFNPRRTSSQWLRDVYPTLADGDALHECVLSAGEALYLPTEWFHATLSLGESVSVSLFDNGRYQHLKSRADEWPAAHAFAEALEAIDARDWRTAQRYLQRMVDLRPDSFVPWSFLGLSTVFVWQEHTKQMSDLDLAVRAFERCAELNPLYATCQTWLGRVLRARAGTPPVNPATQRRQIARADAAGRRAAELSHDGDDAFLGYEKDE